MKTRITGILSVCVLFVAGCGAKISGPDLAPVVGTVTLDGNPLSQASVEFAPLEVEVAEGNIGGAGANGETDADGRFVMYVASREGVQPGKYSVRISKLHYDEATSLEHETIPAMYNEESELEVTIPSEGNKALNFELSSQ